MSKNAVIALLCVAVAVLSGIVIADRAPKIAGALEAPPSGEPVRIVEVVVDRDGRRFVDFVFDQPLGEGKVGDVLAEDPAKIEPQTGGASNRGFG